MTQASRDPLLLVGKAACLVLQVLMAIGATALVAGIFGTLFLTPDIAGRAGLDSFPADFPRALLAAIMALGLGIVTSLFLFFGSLRKIIATVGEGDPFQPQNAVRLGQMAWLMLSTQVLILIAVPLGLQLAKYEDAASGVGADIDANLDFSGLLLVVVLFILARVFRHGAAMRADLEGTV